MQATPASSEEFVPTKVIPDPPPRRPPEPPIEHPPSWDLDGVYLWIGPLAAGSRLTAESQWDSTIGGDLTVVRVREGAWLGTIGGSLGASRWTARNGGRLWLDAVVGTRFGRMVGLTAGPLLELNELAHPRLGASVGMWAFLGVTPFVRVGSVQELGHFVDVGLHVTLPVTRRRH